MTDSKPDGTDVMVTGGKPRWMQNGVLAAVCALMIGVYAFGAHSGVLESLSLGAADTYYDLLVQGFCAGQLSLKKEVPPGLAQLADPYDPAANALYRSPSYRMLDLSYYKGRLYLYFGVTPALILFWPYAALTGHYLFHRQAVAVFCAIGFLSSAGLLRALWRRYFAEVSVGVVAACVLALGLATGVPVLLSRSDVYEVPVSCGYMLTMLALGALWRAVHAPEPRKSSRWFTTPGAWLALASLAYGLAVGARPDLLLGAIILLVPVAHAWRERRPMVALLMAAAAPILVIGLGLMLYNALRFENPFEFGGRYQLGPGRQDTLQFFSLRYLWFNFRVYFLEPARWGGRFPFVREAVLPDLPPGHHGNLQDSFGILTNIPLVWLALAVPLAGRSQSAEARSVLQRFLAAVTMLFVICALTLGGFFAVAMRHEMEFLPALVLLAVVGIFGLEHALAKRPVWRCAARWGWGLLLAYSVLFNLLVCAEHYAEAQCRMGTTLSRAGRIKDAMRYYQVALRIKPDLFEAHNNLASALANLGKLEDAIQHFEQALRSEPGRAEPHNNLGNVLEQMGRHQEAIRHYEQALRIKPDYAEAHNNLGIVLERMGKFEDAIGHYEQALQARPEYAEAHYDLGNAQLQLGRLEDAIDHHEQALRIDPDFAEAHNSLGIALHRAGRVEEAIEHYEQAVRVKPDYAEAHYNLGFILEQVGRVQEAITQYEQAQRIKPEFTSAQNALARLRAVH